MGDNRPVDKSSIQPDFPAAGVALPPFRPLPEDSEYADLNDHLQDIFVEEYVQPILSGPAPARHSLFAPENNFGPVRIDGTIGTEEELRMAISAYLALFELAGREGDFFSAREKALVEHLLRMSEAEAEDDSESSLFKVPYLAVKYSLGRLLTDGAGLNGFERFFAYYLYREMETAVLSEPSSESPFRLITRLEYRFDDLREDAGFLNFLELQTPLSEQDFENFTGTPFDYVAAERPDSPTVVVFLDHHQNDVLHRSNLHDAGLLRETGKFEQMGVEGLEYLEDGKEGVGYEFVGFNHLDEIAEQAEPEKPGFPENIFYDDLLVRILRSRFALDNMLGLMELWETDRAMMQMGAAHYASLRSIAFRRGDANVIFVRPEPTPVSAPTP